MHCCAREVAFTEKLVKLGAAKGRADEDDDLVELEAVEQIVELSILLALIELQIVLLQTMESQLLLVIDVDLQRVLHELLADKSDLLG